MSTGPDDALSSEPVFRMRWRIERASALLRQASIRDFGIAAMISTAFLVLVTRVSARIAGGLLLCELVFEHQGLRGEGAAPSAAILFV